MNGVLSRAVLACLIAMFAYSGEVLAAKGGRPATTRTTYTQPQTRGGPADLVVEDEEDGKRELNIEVRCKVDMDAARLRWQTAVERDKKCRAIRERYKEIHAGNTEALEHVQSMCPTPAYETPLCEQCAESQACKNKWQQVKLWRSCRQEQITEGQKQGFDSLMIDSNIKNFCGPQIRLDTAYALLPNGASKAVVIKPLQNRPAAPAKPRTPQPAPAKKVVTKK